MSENNENKRDHRDSKRDDRYYSSRYGNDKDSENCDIDHHGHKRDHYSDHGHNHHNHRDHHDHRDHGRYHEKHDDYDEHKDHGRSDHKRHRHIHRSEIQKMIDKSLPDMSVVDAFLFGIDDYECSKEEEFQCGEVVVYKGEFHQSKINGNDRHPHDSDAWKGHGNLKSIFSLLSKFEDKAMISIDYHESCDGGCVDVAEDGQCVAIRHDTGEKDSCGNAVMVNHYYISNEDRNINVPAPDADSWDGPFDVCDLIKGAGLTPENACRAIGELDNCVGFVGGN